VIQPTFIYFEGDDLFRDVGEELAHEYKPAKTYLKRGIPMIASSDIPSTFHYNPFISLYSLVTRKTHKGTVIAPEEAISRMEALRSYTASPTRLTREEHLKGVLMPGMSADMAVFDRDYLTCSDDDILNIKVTMTILVAMWFTTRLNHLSHGALCQWHNAPSFVLYGFGAPILRKMVYFMVHQV
jgi:predicted amidohydrolase YtcJ